MQMKIKELFPPGGIPEEDYKTLTFLDRVDEVFEVIVLRIKDVFASIPDKKCGPLYHGWQRVTGLDDPGSGLRRRCDYYEDLNLSNTKEHFESVNPEDMLVFSPNRVTVFLQRPITTGEQRSGMGIGRPIRKFKRPEEVIKKYEKMRHAHIIMEYKNA